jgi:hypothetical protein
MVEEISLFGFQSVARSVVETAARAAPVLDTSIDIRERVIRSSLLELENITEAKKVEVAGGGDGSNFNQGIIDFRIKMALLDIPEKTTNGGRITGLDGRTLPSRLEAVKGLLPQLGVSHGELWYRSISGVCHSTLFGITEYLEAGEMLPGGMTTPLPVLPVHTVANAVVLSLAAYLRVVEYHSFLWGRDASAIAAKRVEAAGELLSAINRGQAG